MIPCTCMVQRGQVPDDSADVLRDRLQAFSRDAFGEPMDIRWVTIAPGMGFTAGRPSTSSIVSVTANAPVEQPRRVALMNALCDLWMEETRCSVDEIVAVLSDPR